MSRCCTHCGSDARSCKPLPCGCRGLVCAACSSKFRRCDKCDAPFAVLTGTRTRPAFRFDMCLLVLAHLLVVGASALGIWTAVRRATALWSMQEHAGYFLDMGVATGFFIAAIVGTLFYLADGLQQAHPRVALRELATTEFFIGFGATTVLSAIAWSISVRVVSDGFLSVWTFWAACSAALTALGNFSRRPCAVCRPWWNPRTRTNSSD